MSIFSQRRFNPSYVRKKIVFTFKCWRQSAVDVKPFLISSKHSYWLLVSNFVTFLFGLTKILSWNLFVLTQIQADILSKTKSLFCNILLPELESKTCQWFHIKCMWIKKIPKGKLFCVKCKTKQKNKKKTIEAIKNRWKIFQLGLYTFYKHNFHRHV